MQQIVCYIIKYKKKKTSKIKKLKLFVFIDLVYPAQMVGTKVPDSKTK